MIQEQTSAVSILSIFGTTKEQRESFADSVILSLQEGHADPLQIHLQVKCAEELISNLKDNKEYKELVLNKAQQYGKKFDYHQAQVEIKEVGVKYDFTVCNDTEWANLQSEMAALKLKIANREKFLKNIPASGVADSETAEMLYPPTKSSTTATVVTLK